MKTRTMAVVAYRPGTLEDPILSQCVRRAENWQVIDEMKAALPESIAAEGMGLRPILRREPAPELGDWAFRCRMSDQRNLFVELYLLGKHDGLFAGPGGITMPAAYFEVKAGSPPVLAYACDGVVKLPKEIVEQGLREAYHAAQMIAWAYVDGPASKMAAAPKEVQ